MKTNCPSLQSHKSTKTKKRGKLEENGRSYEEEFKVIELIKVMVPRIRVGVSELVIHLPINSMTGILSFTFNSFRKTSRICQFSSKIIQKSSEIAY